MTEPKRDSSIEHLKPALAYAAGRIQRQLEREGHPIRIIETARSWERQEWLYASGRTRPGPILTRVQPGGSHHTPDENGQASACDWLWVHDDPWSLERPWSRLGELAETEGLTWGGRWTSPVDLGHVQL